MAWQNVLYAARVAAELGVDLIKTNYPGSPEDFEKVVRGTPTRVLVAGGAPGGTIDSYLQMTRDVIDAGGKGVTYGRFVFQYTTVVPVIRPNCCKLLEMAETRSKSDCRVPLGAAIFCR